VTLAVVLLSGGTGTDSRTPAALPGLPPPFLGVAVLGSGGRAEAIDAYGDVVGRWAPGPAGQSLIPNPPERQAAGSVPANTGIVARMRIGRSRLPLWRADSVTQRYVPGSNVLRTRARIDSRTVEVVRAVGARSLECVVGASTCLEPAMKAAASADRRWLARARTLNAAAPRWTRAMYRRSLLVLRALTDRRTGAVAAGPREGWAYVWPRDASAVAMALASAGYEPEARRIVRFLERLDLDAAARFHGTGEAVDGRLAQGDALGWVAAAARAAGATRDRAEPPAADGSSPATSWEGLADYQEGDSGDFLGNAVAAAAAVPPGPTRQRSEVATRARFGTQAGLTRSADEPDSGLDSAAAWAVRPFPQPGLFPLVRRTLLTLAAHSGRFGIVPSRGWEGGIDPWTAPTAWSAWSLATLARMEQVRSPHASRRDRQAALRLMAELRRAATPTGLLPERVDARTGIPRSTTPLAWSHAFAILALRQLWPGARQRNSWKRR
jgi:hypothetical protein